MKTITLLAAAAVLLTSCSDDDSNKETCDCYKITATYNETLEVYDPVSEEYYSDDCNDETQLFNPNGDGTYYRINCTPAD